MANRFLLLLTALSALAVPTGAMEPVVVYVDEDAGHFWLGLDDVAVGAPDEGALVPKTGVGPVNVQRYVVDVDQCHRSLWFALHYDPEGVQATVGSNSAGLGYTFRVTIHNDTLAYAQSANVSASGDAFRLGTAPEAGRYDVDVWMRSGVDVAWTFALRGLDVLRFSPAEWEPACARVRVSEVESNPAGVDTGNESVELHNEEFAAVDLSGWTIRSLHGVPHALVLPSSTVVPAEGYLVVPLTAGQFLDNVDEAVVLTNAWGLEVDRTPAQSDTANDARTHQLTQGAGGSDVWTFAPGTLGGPN